VDQASNGTLGYLHIRGMNFPSFHRFEQELFMAGAGKDGLIIDVRNNGGGSTADHLLTALTQPVHAIAVPRGGGPGYPQDRMVYATWNKPIVVLCNQNSFSNAEIFAHAIKNLKRGQLVGVTTAGGVISTGGIPIMDIGFLRMPFRGWFTVNDGEDMELHGAVPDHIVWPEPGDAEDKQLSKSVLRMFGSSAVCPPLPVGEGVGFSRRVRGGRTDPKRSRTVKLLVRAKRRPLIRRSAAPSPTGRRGQIPIRRLPQHALRRSRF